MLRGLGKVPDEQPPIADRDLVHDPAAEILREHALEFIVADRGAIVAQDLVAALRRVGQLGGLLEAAFGKEPKYLPGGCARAPRFRGTRIQNFVAQGGAAAEV